MNSCKYVSIAALRHNIRVLRSYVAPTVKLCLVVKANAYGHGIRSVLQCGAVRQVASLAVANLEEALELSGAGPAVRCLLPMDDAAHLLPSNLVDEALRDGVIFSVTSFDGLRYLMRRGAAHRLPVRVDLMLNTGMHRGEATPQQYDELLARTRSSPAVILEGLSTHFCDADAREPDTICAQLACFAAAAPDWLGVPRHAANTAALMRLPESHFEMVRPGLGLYGVDPGDSDLRGTLRPALRWETHVISVKRVPAGAGVGYGPTWRAPTTTHIGLLPVGYADGFGRRLSNRGQVIIKGQARPVVGNVSMNLTTVDLGPVPDVRAGDRATLLDDDPKSPASVYHWAAHLQTIPYEVLTTAGASAPVRVIDTHTSEPRHDRHELRPAS